MVCQQCFIVVVYEAVHETFVYCRRTGRKVKKPFSFSTQVAEHKIILLINVKMSTIVGILTFISGINASSERLKARNFFVGILVFFLSSWNFVLS